MRRVVISIYDIQRAVVAQSRRPIYYESRVAKLGLNQSELPKIDEEFEADRSRRDIPARPGMALAVNRSS